MKDFEFKDKMIYNTIFYIAFNLFPFFILWGEGGIIS